MYNGGWVSCGDMVANLLDCDIIVSEFELHLRY